MANKLEVQLREKETGDMGAAGSDAPAVSGLNPELNRLSAAARTSARTGQGPCNAHLPFASGKSTQVNFPAKVNI